MITLLMALFQVCSCFKPVLSHLQSAGCWNSVFPWEVLEECAAPDEVPPSPADLTMFANEACVELK